MFRFECGWMGVCAGGCLLCTPYRSASCNHSSLGKLSRDKLFANNVNVVKKLNYATKFVYWAGAVAHICRIWTYPTLIGHRSPSMGVRFYWKFSKINCEAYWFRHLLSRPSKVSRFLWLFVGFFGFISGRTTQIYATRCPGVQARQLHNASQM